MEMIEFNQVKCCKCSSLALAALLVASVGSGEICIIIFFALLHTYILRHVSHGDTSQRQKDEKRVCHWYKFSLSHGCVQAKLSIPPDRNKM